MTEKEKTGWIASKLQNKAYLLLFIVVAVVASLFLTSLAKCHYSASSGAHCNALLDAPHIHPFANH